MNQDIELQCDKCGYETLVTDGCYDKKCRHCGGVRKVVKEHGRILSFDEVKKLGYVIC